MKTRLATVAPSLVLLVTLVAHADGGPTLHEFVPEVGEDEGSLLVSSGGAQPDAILYQGEVLPAPAPTALGADERPMRAGPGDGAAQEEVGRRSPGFRPDRVTHLDGTVGYYTVFTPAIAPFKRVTGLDSVTLAEDGTPLLAIAEPNVRRAVPVLGAHAGDPDERTRDRFWGSVVLDFAEGRTVPFPAVSPESRVLTLETDPPTAITLEKDGADNLYAVAPVGQVGLVRAVFLMDAPRDYFGRPLGDGPADVHARLVRALPPPVERDATTFAAELGLSRGTSFARALSVLTEHFRSFVEHEQPPTDTGNIYLDLSRGERGICRHRAYAFVITAHALGMHARFVSNEAHAWAEVMLPDGGWLRVDLGGAASGLEARGARDRPVYRPTAADPLPRPREYEAAYEEASRMSGLRPPDAETSSAGGANGATGSSGGRSGSGAGAGTGGGATTAAIGGGGGLSDRGPLSLVLDERRFEVFRGQELEVTGAARGGDVGVPGLRVEVLLRAERGDAEWLLGVTVTRDEGRFRQVLGVPPELPVGDYRLIVRSPGNDAWGPAIAP